MRDFFIVLVGGICSALGGCVAACASIWYRAKKARHIKMEERAAEVQFEAQRKALALIRKLRTSLVQRDHGAARQFFCDNGQWFSDNWMFLPDEYVDKWKTIWLKLCGLERAEQAQQRTRDDKKKDEYIEKAVNLESELVELAKEAENALRRKMGLEHAE